MPDEDPRIAQYEAERLKAIEIAHKAMISSYIGPPPKLRGDAERMVAALIKAGWTPPGEQVTEHATDFKSGAKLVRWDGPELERVYPLEYWIRDRLSFYEKVYRRKIIVVEDWVSVTSP